MKKLLFISLFVFVVIISACSSANENGNTEEQTEQQEAVITNVNVDQFSELVTKGEGQILDVRTPEEWAEGTVEGANKINLFDDDFEAQLTKLDKDKPVYVYCKAGSRSSKAADKMEEMGFKKVYNLEGGMDAWKDAGKNVVK